MYVLNSTITSTLYTASATQGAALGLASVFVRAINSCQTPNQDYGLGVPPCAAAADPTRICGSFNNPLAGGNNYIVGSSGGAASDDGVLASTGACAVNINEQGNATANPITHRFRIDLQVTPGVNPVVTPGFYRLQMNFVIRDDDQTVPILSVPAFFDIEIEPILQMNLKSADQIDFSFNDMRDYATGVTKYGATAIELRSNMNWDFMTYATSIANETTAGGTPIWDVNMNYSATGGSNQVPLYVLELHQTPANPLASGAGVDYSPAFPAPPFACSDNYIEVAHRAGAAIVFTLNPCNADQGDKTIAGNWEGGAGGTFMVPGMYAPDLVVPVNEWTASNFRYVFDYRLVPGLPATFNGAIATFVRPGSYSMQIRYFITEDQ